MGVINITQRSERLGNLGGTSMAHGVTNTNIGQVHHTVARTFSPHYYNRNSHAGDGAIADGLGRIGDTLVRIGAAVVQREEDRKVDDYANAMLDNMEKMGRDDRDIDDWNTPDRKHLQGQKRGFYLRTGEGTKTVVDEWDRAFADTFRKIGDSIDANDRVRERTMEKLANYRRATVSRLADHQAAEYRRMELDSAKGNLTSQIALWKNGRTEVLPDIFAQQERVDSLSLATPEKRKANREALALKLTSDFVGNSLDQCQTPEDFDKVEEAVRGGLKDALPDLIADNLPGGERIVGGKMKDALLTDVRRARQSFEIQRDREEREQLSELVAFSDNALARGGIDDLEAASTDMAWRAALMPRGSRLETVALQQADRLDSAADAEAKRLVLDSLLEHADDKTPWKPPKGSRMEKFYALVKERLEDQAAIKSAKLSRRAAAEDAKTARMTWEAILEHANDDEPWAPPKGSPMERFYAPLKASFEQQRDAYIAGILTEQAKAIHDQRKANETTLRAQMMTAAATAPGTFLARLADLTVKGHLSVDQYRKLTVEFNTVWTKEGLPRKAALMEDAYREIIGSGENGMFDVVMAYNPHTVERVSSGLYSEYESAAPDNIKVYGQEKFTAEDYSALFKWATRLARLDGQTTTIDPVTQELLEKPKKIDSVDEFRRVCYELKNVARVRSARDVVKRSVDALADINIRMGNENRAFIDEAEKVDAEENRVLQTLKQQKRKPFTPKMPRLNAYQIEAPADDEPET